MINMINNTSSFHVIFYVEHETKSAFPKKKTIITKIYDQHSKSEKVCFDLPTVGGHYPVCTAVVTINPATQSTMMLQGANINIVLYL